MCIQCPYDETVAIQNQREEHRPFELAEPAGDALVSKHCPACNVALRAAIGNKRVKHCNDKKRIPVIVLTIDEYETKRLMLGVNGFTVPPKLSDFLSDLEAHPEKEYIRNDNRDLYTRDCQMKRILTGGSMLYSPEGRAAEGPRCSEAEDDV